MPTYQYACTDAECGNRFELVQSFTDPNASECPVCHHAVRKVYGSVGVVFKGSGFYRNDSRAASSTSEAPSTSSPEGSKSESKSDSSAKTESGSKSDSGSSPKSDAKSGGDSKSGSGSKSDSKSSAAAAS